MTKLYTKNGARPIRPPWRIRLSDGSTRTDPSTFTAEEIIDAGYIEVEPPPEVTETQMLDWDGTQWIIVDIPETPP